MNAPGATALAAWRKFFLIRLPLAALVLGLIVEVPAYFLSGITMHRHNVDDLASAVLHDKHPYRVVLVGDSVTHNVAHKFRIGDTGEVADLTTHAQAGLPSSVFLLKRYLEAGNRPRFVVLATSRDPFVLPLEKDTFRMYVQSVFTQPYERDYLSRNYPDYVDYRWRPAALSVETAVIEPLFSLVRHPKDEIWSAPDVPSPDPRLEQFSNDHIDQGVFQNRVAMKFEVRPEARAAMEEICRLSQQYKFELRFIWAPMEPKLRGTLQTNGSLERVNQELAQLFASNQAAVTLEDSSSKRDYPYFDHGLIHIKGSGWEQVYADQLSAFIHEFDVTTTQPITAQTK
jgi:hypothetical protein